MLSEGLAAVGISRKFWRNHPSTKCLAHAHSENLFELLQKQPSSDWRNFIALAHASQLNGGIDAHICHPNILRVTSQKSLEGNFKSAHTPTNMKYLSCPRLALSRDSRRSAYPREEPATAPTMSTSTSQESRLTNNLKSDISTH
jgi:hypothetical protein